MKRFLILALATTMSAAALAQNWQGFYIGGLNCAKGENWSDARIDFKLASRNRPADSETIQVAGSFTSGPWKRDEAYSPNFLAAYAGLKQALTLKAGTLRATLLGEVESEFEGLLKRQQYSSELFFFLDQTYGLTGHNEKRVLLAKQYASIADKVGWKVDQTGIDPADAQLISELPAPNDEPADNEEQALNQVHFSVYSPSEEAAATKIAIKQTAQSAAPLAPSQPRTEIKQETESTAPVKKTAEKPAKVTEPVGLTVVHSESIKPLPEPEATATPSHPVPDKPFEASQVSVAAQSAADKENLNHGKAPRKHDSIVLSGPTPTVSNAKTQVHFNPAPSTAIVNISKSSEQTSAQKPTVVLLQPIAPMPIPAVKLDLDAVALPADTPILTPVLDQKKIASGPVKPVSVKSIGHQTKAKVDPKSTVVPTIDTKYALIIGNSESKMDGGAIPYASSDAQLVRQALITNAGYLDSNIEVVVNGTAAQIADTVNALASRLPDKATVLVYFTGVGVDIDGKDYLAGVDSDVNNDSSTMIPKDDVYKAFMLRGARVFAFFQANRPLQQGHYFGSEIPLVGSISQMQATLPGAAILNINPGGKQVGLFTNAFVETLGDQRSNQTPVMDFGWQLFYKLRSGDTGSEGGSSNQSPSLPVLTNMAADARF